MGINSSVSLVTSADLNEWKSGCRMLCLGSWCLQAQSLSNLAGVDYEILPYHWDDRQRFERDYCYVRRLGTFYLAGVTTVLNRLHRVDMPQRYWNIFLGNWLLDFLGIFFDRYLSIRTASNTEPAAEAVLPALCKSSFSCPNIGDRHTFYLEDAVNRQMYGYIIRRLKCCSFTEDDASIREGTLRDRSESAVSLRSRFYGILRSMCARIVNRSVSFSERVVFSSDYFPYVDFVRLALRMRALPIRVRMPTNRRSVSFDDKSRAQLVTDLQEFHEASGVLKPMTRACQKDEVFERLLPEAIAFHLPRTAVEGFSALRREAEEELPRAVGAIFSANSILCNDAFKVWAAKKAVEGVPLLIHQHGGLYGAAAFLATEEYEVEIADRYYSWGWTNNREARVVPMPASKLVNVTRRIRARGEGQILIGSNSAPARFYRFGSMPIGGQLISFFDWHVRFLKALDSKTLSLCLLRLYPTDYGWSELCYYRAHVPTLRVYRGKASVYSQLRRSRLFVATNNQTVHLETIAANFPTIMFWDPQLWELRPEARIYFDKLRDVGVFHETPESAADMTCRVAGDPIGWWNTREVQAVRREFSDRFAKTSHEWCRLWQRELTSFLKSS